MRKYWIEKVILTPLEQGKNLILNENQTELFADLAKKSATSSVNSRTPQNDIEKSDNKTIILVVEDNYDMREYIKESLSDSYAVEEAVNGEQGVRIAETIIPDLIISDLMMPKMDGNELTRILEER